MQLTRPTRRDLLWALACGVFLFLALGGLWKNTLVALALTLAAMAAELIWPKRVRMDSDHCSKCGHQRLDHHGPCQACLRAVRDRDAAAPATPCGRFSSKRDHQPEGNVSETR